MTSPLTDLTKKTKKKFTFTEAAGVAFKQLQLAFTTATVLQHFQPHLPLTMETDASDFSIGCILSQPSPPGDIQDGLPLWLPTSSTFSTARGPTMAKQTPSPDDQTINPLPLPLFLSCLPLSSLPSYPPPIQAMSLPPLTWRRPSLCRQMIPSFLQSRQPKPWIPPSPLSSKTT